MVEEEAESRLFWMTQPPCSLLLAGGRGFLIPNQNHTHLPLTNTCCKRLQAQAGIQSSRKHGSLPSYPYSTAACYVQEEILQQLGGGGVRAGLNQEQRI